MPIYEHSGNSVAYPLNSHALLKRLGVRAQDLPVGLTVLFEGPDREVVSKDPPLRVRTGKLRKAFRWLLFNCWPWLQATKELPITADYLGCDIEETLTSYGDDTEAGVVPRVLVTSAVSVGEPDTRRTQQGPADAVASDSSSEEGAASVPTSTQPKVQCERRKHTMPFNGAVFENNNEHMSVIQEWDHIVRNTDVLGSVSRALESLEASTLSPEDQEKLRRDQELRCPPGLAPLTGVIT